MERGYIQIYTGNGKGKTTAMLGLALRGSGAGLKIYIGQFIKNGEYSEIKAIEKYLPDIEVEQFGKGFIFSRKATANDIESAKAGLKKAVEVMISGKYDVIMLDEINVAVYYGLISVEGVLDLIRQKPQNVELILTGRHAAKEIIEAADLVSEIKEVKHYYLKGTTGREGIEK